MSARQRQRLRICGVRLLKLGVVRASCPQVTLVASSTVVPTNSRRCSPAAARTPVDRLVYDEGPTQIFFDSRCIA